MFLSRIHVSLSKQINKTLEKVGRGAENERWESSQPPRLLPDLFADHFLLGFQRRVKSSDFQEWG